MTLRQRHTEGAILYEKKLKPFLKSLNEGKGTFLLTLPSLAYRSLSWGGEGVGATVFLFPVGWPCPPCPRQGGLTRERGHCPR